MKTFTYIYQATYGSPEVDHDHAEDHQGDRRPGRQERAADVEGLQEGHIHDLTAAGRAVPRTARRCCIRRRITR